MKGNEELNFTDCDIIDMMTMELPIPIKDHDKVKNPILYTVKASDQLTILSTMSKTKKKLTLATSCF